MRISIDKKGGKIYFNVTPSQRSRVKRFYYTISQVIENLKEKYDLSEYNFISEESGGDFFYGIDKATYVFGKKIVDNKKNYVKIDQTMETESLKNKEQKKEVSLPYGLKKQTKTRKTKATKKKTEE